MHAECKACLIRYLIKEWDESYTLDLFATYSEYTTIDNCTY